VQFLALTWIVTPAPRPQHHPIPQHHCGCSSGGITCLGISTSSAWLSNQDLNEKSERLFSD